MVTADPSFASADVHHRAGRLRDAEPLYRDVVRRDPRHHEAFGRLGLIALDDARPDAAVECFQRAAEIAPSVADYHLNLGVALRQLARFDTAAAAFTQAVSLRPEWAEAHFNLGVVLEQMSSPFMVQAFERAAALAPDNAAIVSRVAAALTRRNELGRSLVHWQRTVALEPASVTHLVELGTNQRLLGDYDAAVATLRRALSMDSRHVTALAELAGALIELRAFDEAEDLLRRALAEARDYVPALFNLGSVSMLLGKNAEAASALRRLLERTPDNAEARSNLLVVMNYLPDTTDRDILREAEEWGRLHAPSAPARIPLRAAAREAGARLRVGYLSADFGSLAPFLPPVLEHHDRAAFELVFYSGERLPDVVLDSAARRGDKIREIGAFNDDDLVRLVREDEVDVLVDVTMHLSGSRLKALAKRAAPVQIAWLAYPGTTGLPAMDFRLTDPYLDPRDRGELPYTEESIWLPEAFWPYAALEGELDCGELPAIRNGFVTFGSLNAFSKMHDALVDAWARVLARVHGSRLLLLAPEGRSRSSVAERLGTRGIASDRVEFVGRQARRPYLETFRRIDVALDAFPANGHTTSLDAYHMGVPVITLAGDRVVGRAGACIARNLGMSELVGGSVDEYVETAVRVSRDLPRLAELRAGLRERMRRSVFMDGARFVHHLEEAYREAVTRTVARHG